MTDGLVGVNVERTADSEKRWQAGRRLKIALIRDAAVQQFSRYGYASSSLQDVARATGMHKATLYHYFVSKELLLAHILDYAHDQIAAILQKVQDLDTDPISRIRAFIKLQMCWYLDNVDLARVTFHEWTNVGADLIDHHTERRRVYDRFFRALIVRLQEDGLAPSRMNASLAANYITGAINAAPAWFNSKGRLSSGEIAEIFAGHSLLLLGLAAASPQAIISVNGKKRRAIVRA